MNKELLLSNLRSIPDFPIPGILFRDVTTLFKSAECLKELEDTLYEIYKDKCSFSEMKKICYGSQFQHLPIYKKRQKQWILNGTCIDYPRLEEY